MSFSQGDRAEDIFFIIKGRVKVTVVSEEGKERVIAIHEADRMDPAFGFDEIQSHGHVFVRRRRFVDTYFRETALIRLSAKN
ncbi:MAG TPA: cyclic nucleotide-binding domain-containing protein [Xanthobacteraceae bacterium]|nr:cyclic nucleotide-binding domain-containing protein [Xanthobacteraceae bacterium]